MALWASEVKMLRTALPEYELSPCVACGRGPGVRPAGERSGWQSSGRTCRTNRTCAA